MYWLHGAGALSWACGVTGYVDTPRLEGKVLIVFVNGFGLFARGFRAHMCPAQTNLGAECNAFQLNLTNI